ncbi:MAG TPA: hypothetical protein VFQ53_22990 [Kofleriaceae bacterium]|nr:hypothetical protein [Kofleriaceae bacterium]
MFRTLVLLAGLAGLIGFFLPLRKYASTDSAVFAQASAFQIARGGGGDTQGIVEQAKKLGLSEQDAAKLTKALDKGLYEYRLTMLALFAPAALLFLLGFVALVRHGIGRFGGVLAIALGLASIAAFVLVLMLVGDLDIKERTVSLTLGGSAGPGMYCLLAAGVLGMLGGFGAAMRPDDFI